MISKGFPMISKGFPMISDDFQRFPMISKDSLWFPMISNDFQRFVHRFPIVVYPYGTYLSFKIIICHIYKVLLLLEAVCTYYLHCFIQESILYIPI